MYRFTVPFDPERYTAMRFVTGKRGWLQRAARQRLPEAAAVLFDGGKADGLIDITALAPGLAIDVRRLLPWAGEQVRRLPAVALYASRDGLLMIDVRDPGCREAAEAVAGLAAELIAERFGTPWAPALPEALPMGIRRTPGTTYHVVRFRTDAGDPVDTDEDAVRHLIYNGLVRALLCEPDAAALLGMVPAARDAGLCIDAMPQPDQHQRFAGKTQHHGFVFSIDVDVDGPWSVGGGALFGFGAVYRDNAWESHAIMRRARFGVFER